MITIDNKLRIPLDDLREDALEEIKRRMIFKNPQYGAAVGRMLSQGIPDPKPYGVPQFIQGWQISQGTLILPRGCTGEVLQFLHEINNPVLISQKTRKLPPVDFDFRGKLRPDQEQAMEKILERRFGTLCAPTGSGKTVMGLYAIAMRKQPALVVVHTTSLAAQWMERAVQFLGIPQTEIGIIGSGSRRAGKRLTIALVQTLRKCAEEMKQYFGHLIIDECHHTPASTFLEVVSPFDANFSLGLSATHKRRDGMTPLIYWNIGPLLYEIKRSGLIQSGDIIPVTPIIRETDFTPSHDIDPTWQRTALIQQLSANDKRNMLIASDVANEAKRGPCIVLTDRKFHCDRLASFIAPFGIKVEVCHGEIRKDIQEQIIKALGDGRLQVVVATGQLLGEGFDCKGLTALFLATPIKFDGRLIQYLGRVARAAEGKAEARVYDYHDINVEVLMKAARERMRTYRRLMRQDTAPTPTRRKKG